MAVALPLPAARLVARHVTLSRAGEAVLVVALVAGAAGLRYPYLWQIPELTDELSEIWRGYQIYRGEILPLTNFTTFVGPLWNYLVAALFWISGPSPYSPRLLVMLLATLTIVPTYLLGREIGGPRAGLVAAAMLATSGGHIASNSHIAWSNCLTPLFGTTAFWLLARAANRHSGPALVGAGLFSGLALLTHGTFVFLLPGVAAFVLWRGRTLLRTRWLAPALLAFLLGFWPLIVFNLQSGFRTVAEAEARAGRTRQNSPLPTPQAYLLRTPVILTSALRLVGGAIDERDGDVSAYLLDPKLWPYGALALAGLALAWRRGQPLPALIVGSGLLIWPLFNQKVESLPQEGRYLFPMLPPVFAAIGLVLGSLLARRSPWAPAIWLSSGLLLAYPLLPLWSYYGQKLESGRTNEVGYDMLATVERSIRPPERVLLDAGINRYSFGGNGGGQRAFRQLLGLRGIAAVDLEMGDDVADYLRCGQSALLIMRSMEFRKYGEQTSSLERNGLQRAALAPPSAANPVFGLYRVSRVGCSDRPETGPQRRS